jgi:hypothetical protein
MREDKDLRVSILVKERVKWRLLRSIACEPEKIFLNLAHLVTQGYRGALPNTRLPTRSKCGK